MRGENESRSGLQADNGRLAARGSYFVMTVTVTTVTLRTFQNTCPVFKFCEHCWNIASNMLKYLNQKTGQIYVITQNRGSTKSAFIQNIFNIECKKVGHLANITAKRVHSSISNSSPNSKNWTNTFCPQIAKLFFLKKKNNQIVWKAEEWGLKGYWCCYWQCLLTHWWRRN